MKSLLCIPLLLFSVFLPLEAQVVDESHRDSTILYKESLEALEKGDIATASSKLHSALFRGDTARFVAKRFRIRCGGPGSELSVLETYNMGNDPINESTHTSLLRALGYRLIGSKWQSINSASTAFVKDSTNWLAALLMAKQHTEHVFGDFTDFERALTLSNNHPEVVLSYVSHVLQLDEDDIPRINRLVELVFQDSATNELAALRLAMYLKPVHLHLLDSIESAFYQVCSATEYSSQVESAYTYLTGKIQSQYVRDVLEYWYAYLSGNPEYKQMYANITASEFEYAVAEELIFSFSPTSTNSIPPRREPFFNRGLFEFGRKCVVPNAPQR